MTMTTDRPAEAPAWLDVDKIAPRDLRDRIAALTATLQEARAMLEPIAEQFAQLAAENEIAEGVAVDELERLFGDLDRRAAKSFAEVVCVLTGWRAAFSAASAIHNLLEDQL